MDSFSHTYAGARDKFFRAAEKAKFKTTSHVHPLKGLAGEELATDVVEHIPAQMEKLLIVSSGLHGVEGYAGSAVQIAALGALTLPKTTGIVFVHAINPWGMAHHTRTNENNVDVNRNFLSSFAGDRLPREHPLTASAHQAFVAASHDDSLREQFRRDYPHEFQAALTQGQYSNPHGLFYGGNQAEWSNLTWRKIITAYGEYQDIVHIDIHTGLGARGVGELISASPHGAPGFKRAEAIWGEGEVTSCADGSSTSAYLTGTIENSLPEAVTSITIEFGTLPVKDVIEALIVSNRSQIDGFQDATLRADAVQQVEEAFCPDDAAWLAAITGRGLNVIQTGGGLRSAKPA